MKLSFAGTAARFESNSIAMDGMFGLPLPAFSPVWNTWNPRAVMVEKSTLAKSTWLPQAAFSVPKSDASPVFALTSRLNEPTP